MGLSILEITEIPQHSLLAAELKDAKREAILSSVIFFRMFRR